MERCSVCNKIITEDEKYKMLEGEYFCEGCAKNYKRCSVCGALVPRDKLYGLGDGYICCDCAKDDYNCVIDYHGFNEWIPKKIPTEKNPLYLGIELEVDNKYDDYAEDNNQLILSRVRTIFEKDLIGSYDGSLRNGFEMVTQPMTLDFWKKNKASQLQEITRFLISHGYISHNTTTCGLHVHVNRDYLGETKEEQENAIDKIYLIMENFKKEFELFARRSSNHYSNFLLDVEENIKENLSICSIKEKKNKHNRYMALNITNDKTIEFRLFKGTLKYTTIMATLELVDIIVNIAKDKTVEELIGITWNDIIDYKKSEYLCSYSQDRNIISNTVLKDYSIEYMKLRIEKNKKQIQEANKENERVKKEINSIIDRFVGLMKEKNVKIYYKNKPLNLYKYAFEHIKDSTDEFIEFINNISVETNDTTLTDLALYKKIVVMIGTVLMIKYTLKDIEHKEDIKVLKINSLIKDEIIHYYNLCRI